MRLILATAALAALAGPASAQDLTTVQTVKPLLELTRDNWVAVREYDGQDLLYFTHLASFRCALNGIRFGVNSPVAALSFETEPCYRGEAVPNALKMVDGKLPFVAFPLGSIQSVKVVITYADGTEETAEYERAAIETK